MKTSDKIVGGLGASSELSKKLHHPGPDIRPCVAQMLESSYTKGDYPNRNAAAHIIACELRRIGCSHDEVLQRIIAWNDGNTAPLSISEYSKAVRSAFAKDYNYSCYHHFLEPTCIGPDACPFSSRVKSNQKYYNNRKFIRYRWPELLPNVAILIYYIALIELERIRQVGAGGMIYASYREIAKLCGVNPGSIMRNLAILQSHGLIELKIGTPRKWERSATEIRRVIPIPRPSQNLLRKLYDEKPYTEK